MTCTIVRDPQPDTLKQRLRRARIHSVFSNDQRTDLEILLDTNSARLPRGKGPTLTRHPAPPQRRALSFRELQSHGVRDDSEYVRNWIEGTAGLILIGLCAWAFVLLAATGAAR